MTLVVIFGPPAVGKMTVGIELERLTGLRLFHNHMTVDLVLQLFPFGTPDFNRLVSEFRTRVCEEVAASDLPGLIFTYVWALDDPRDKEFVDRMASIFTAQGREVCYVELAATVEERLRRNASPLRLEHKAPKRDLGKSRELLLDSDRRYELNTDGEFFYPERHLRIENTKLEPGEVARRVVERFGCPCVSTAESRGEWIVRSACPGSVASGLTGARIRRGA
jgi:hypothetical protein